MNLRSFAAQVSRGGRSVVSRCNFSSSRRSSEPRRPRRRGFADEGVNKTSMSDLFVPSFTIGYCAFTSLEMIQMLEYRQTMERSLEEHHGMRESKVDLLDLLRWLFFE